MWKKAAVGAAALVIAGTMMVYAQQRPGGGDRPRDVAGQDGWHPGAQDMSAFADARIAALHAGLALSADQEKNWPALEQALRELSKMRIERLAAARDQQPPADPITRLQRHADAMTTRGTALKHLADAAAPLYGSLDDSQKHRFAMLARFMRPHGEHRVMWRGRSGEGQDGAGGMRGEGFRMGPHRFGERDGMRGPHGMDGRGNQEDYRGPL